MSTSGALSGMVAASGLRMSDENLKAEGRGSIWLAIASAVGGAILTIVVQIVVDYNRERRAEKQAAIDVATTLQKHQSTRLNDLHEEFDRLGDLPRRAGAYIDGDRVGSVDDVRVVARHLREVVREIRAQRVVEASVALDYSGALLGWSRRFRALHDGSSPRASRFPPTERQNFELIADALDHIAATGNLVASNPLDGLAADTSVASNSAIEVNGRLD